MLPEIGGPETKLCIRDHKLAFHNEKSTWRDNVTQSISGKSPHSMNPFSPMALRNTRTINDDLQFGTQSNGGNSKRKSAIN